MNSPSRRPKRVLLRHASFLLLLLAHRLPAQPAFVTDSLDRYVTRGMADWQIPGLAVAVVKDGKVVCLKGYGVREYGQYREQEALDKARLDADLAQVARKPKPALPLASYAGTYAHPVYGEMTVKREGGKLNLYFSRHPNVVGRLQPKEGNTFLCTYSDPTFGIYPAPFTVEGNAVKSVSVKVNDFLEYDPYVFVRQ